MQGSDEGYLVEIGNNRYQAISYWDENQTYDCYFENESTLYWGSEESGYEVYG